MSVLGVQLDPLLVLAGACISLAACIVILNIFLNKGSSE